MSYPYVISTLFKEASDDSPALTATDIEDFSSYYSLSNLSEHEPTNAELRERLQNISFWTTKSAYGFVSSEFSRVLESKPELGYELDEKVVGGRTTYTVRIPLFSNLPEELRGATLLRETREWKKTVRERNLRRLEKQVIPKRPVQITTERGKKRRTDDEEEENGTSSKRSRKGKAPVYN